MKALRKRPKGAFRRSFGLVLCGTVLAPSSIGYQDLAALIARQPAVTERWRQHIRNSTFGTIHAATFSFPRPIGASMPDPYFTQLATLDPRALEITGSVPLHAPIELVMPPPTYDFPVVDRSLKGDRLMIDKPPAPDHPRAPQPSPSRKGDKAISRAAVPQPELGPLSPQPPSPPRAPATEIADLESERADLSGPIQAPIPRSPASIPTARAQNTPPLAPSPAEIAAPISEPAGERIVDSLEQLSQPAKPTTLYFGTHAIGFGRAAIQPWQPDEAPTVLAAPHTDPEIKRTALDPAPDPETQSSGEMVALKGEVTGEGKRPRTPAERLNLTGAALAKHEKCLANAIYFEARGEVERGQMAVAQVVLNRAFSGYYPGNVCDVVYQNAHRHLACQFTFACDNHRDVVNDQKAWSGATRIARDALGGKFWLPEVGKATHYHATYVNPWWVRTMTKHSRLGIHIFYRPKRWGEGEEIPVWGDRLGTAGTLKPNTGSDQNGGDKRAEAPPPARRSIFDPVDEIKPGG